MHIAHNSAFNTTVATVSFSSATYQYDEDAGDVYITVTRSGNIESKALVLVANDIFQGTATGKAA